MTQRIISAFNKVDENTGQSHTAGFKAAVRRKLRMFRQDDDGSLIIFGLYMFICMLVIGGMAIDTMRSEEQRTRIQYTTDRALLAAAAMNQTLSAQDIFDDYFAKAGMKGMAPTATVINGLNFREVSAEYDPADIPTIDTIFMSRSFRELLKTHPDDGAGGVDKLQTIASGIAVDGVEKVEISLVLDVSGSMDYDSSSGHTKLEDLQVAAKEFVDTLMLNQPDEDTYSISVVPFAAQVNAGESLLSKYNISDEHNYSHCVDFEESDFSSMALSTATELQRTGHFTYWGDSWADRPPSWKHRACPNKAERAILPLSGDIDELKDYIDALYAVGSTSADIGIKWGAALLDPTAQGVVSSLISEDVIDAKFQGRPYALDQEGILKVIVLMSDGDNRPQPYLKPEVSGGYADPEDNMSNVWRRTDTYGRYRYAIYNPDRWGSYKYFHTYLNSTSGYWRSTPLSGMTRLSYVELYDHASIPYVANYMMWPAGYNYNEWRWYKYGSITEDVKDDRMDSICTAAKDNDVLIFTIGFEVTDGNADKLTECATSAGHFFRVEGVEISEAFASIAAQLHRLRLEQ